MFFESIKSLGKKLNHDVKLRGWVYNLRSSKRVKFLVLRDGTGIIQCVYSTENCDAKTLKTFEQLSQECSVEVTGTVKPGARVPEQVEIEAKSLVLLAPSKDYPITPKEHGVDFLMSHRHLWLRSKKQHAILKIRHELIQAIRDFFNLKEFTLIDSPLLTPISCEGTSTLFKTKYFDEEVFLSQSGQLYLEAAAAAFQKVYCFGPTFRAEKSKTRRHLIEFWMAEAEVAFMNLNENMHLAESLLESIVQRVLEKNQEELIVLERDLSFLKKVKAPFPQIHYKEAVEILKKKSSEFNEGDDFGGTDETIIGSCFEKPVFVHHFPSSLKAFYMKRDDEDPHYSLSCDLLAPEGYGEIIGGGQREDNLCVLEERIKKESINREDFNWYLDLRKYGSFPHSGFGLGVERTLSWICGLKHVRETIPFPRLYGRCHP